MSPLPESADQKSGANGKRRSRQLDFTKLEPLKSSKGTMGFSTYRDAETTSPSTFNINGTPSKKSKSPHDMESDDDDDAYARKKKMPEVDNDRDLDVDSNVELSKEELARRSALAEGVQKMKVYYWNKSACCCVILTVIPSSNEYTPARMSTRSFRRYLHRPKATMKIYPTKTNHAMVQPHHQPDSPAHYQRHGKSCQIQATRRVREPARSTVPATQRRTTSNPTA